MAYLFMTLLSQILNVIAFFGIFTRMKKPGYEAQKMSFLTLSILFWLGNF